MKQHFCSLIGTADRFQQGSLTLYVTDFVTRGLAEKRISRGDVMWNQMHTRTAKLNLHVNPWLTLSNSLYGRHHLLKAPHTLAGSVTLADQVSAQVAGGQSYAVNYVRLLGSCANRNNNGVICTVRTNATRLTAAWGGCQLKCLYRPKSRLIIHNKSVGGLSVCRAFNL